MDQWQLQDAKAKFSELVKTAVLDGPQAITVHGKFLVVIISKSKYDELTQPKVSLVQLLRKSPLFGVKLKLKRDKSLNRDVLL